VFHFDESGETSRVIQELHCVIHDTNDILISEIYFLIYLDRRVYLSHECVGADVSDCSAHDAQGQAEQCHVTKVKCCLEETVHSAKIKKHLQNRNFCEQIIIVNKETCICSLSFKEEIIKGINVDITSR